MKAVWRKAAGPQAHARLGDFWRNEGRAAAANYVLSCYEKMKGHLSLVPARIAFLRSMTVEPLMPILRSAALVHGIGATVQVGQFNSYAQEILDPASALYSFEPHIVVLAVQTRDIAPDIWESYADLSEADAQAAVDRVLRDFAGWVRANSASAAMHRS